MQNVADVIEEDVTVLPFGMLFVSVPDTKDRVPSMGNTMTTTYSTDSGPNSSPDDGATATKDD